MQFIALGNMRALLVACVCVPLSLATASIVSTHIDTALQSQPILGIPLFLWLWIFISLTICSSLMWVGSRLSYQDTDVVTQDLVSSDSIVTIEGGRDD